MAPGAEVSTPGAARLAVLGSPIGHSRSPRIHRAAYAVLGLPWEYEAVECGAAELGPWLAERSAAVGAAGGPEWRGLSLTMPLKEEAHRLAAVLDPVAEESGVANTLMHLVGDTWAGFNTDVGGLAAAIREAGLDAARTVVIGSGATAVSAVLAARSLGAERVTVLARREEAARALAERFGAAHGALVGDRAARDATLLVSTLPGPAGRELELPATPTRVPLFDVAYDPWPSPLAERWRAAGGEAHSGLGMLIHQALLQVRIFVGGDPALPLDREDEVLAAMRAAV